MEPSLCFFRLRFIPRSFISLEYSGTEPLRDRRKRYATIAHPGCMWRILAVYRPQEYPVQAVSDSVQRKRCSSHRAQDATLGLGLAEFNFTVEHIPGELNTWADFLIRWAAPGNAEFPFSTLQCFPCSSHHGNLPELPCWKLSPNLRLSHLPLPTPATPRSSTTD